VHKDETDIRGLKRSPGEGRWAGDRHRNREQGRSRREVRSRPWTCLLPCTSLSCGSTQKHPREPDRDRFILSKDTVPSGWYSVLALRGYFPVGELATFDHGDSRAPRPPRYAAHPRSGRLHRLTGARPVRGLRMATGARNGSARTSTPGSCSATARSRKAMVWERRTVRPAVPAGQPDRDQSTSRAGSSTAGLPTAADRFDRGEPGSVTSTSRRCFAASAGTP